MYNIEKLFVALHVKNNRMLQKLFLKYSIKREN